MQQKHNHETPVKKIAITHHRLLLISDGKVHPRPPPKKKKNTLNITGFSSQKFFPAITSCRKHIPLKVCHTFLLPNLFVFFTKMEPSPLQRKGPHQGFWWFLTKSKVGWTSLWNFSPCKHISKAISYMVFRVPAQIIKSPCVFPSAVDLSPNIPTWCKYQFNPHQRF